MSDQQQDTISDLREVTGELIDALRCALLWLERIEEEDAAIVEATMPAHAATLRGMRDIIARATAE